MVLTFQHFIRVVVKSLLSRHSLMNASRFLPPWFILNRWMVVLFRSVHTALTSISFPYSKNSVNILPVYSGVNYVYLLHFTAQLDSQCEMYSLYSALKNSTTEQKKSCSWLVHEWVNDKDRFQTQSCFSLFHSSDLCFYVNMCSCHCLSASFSNIFKPS